MSCPWSPWKRPGRTEGSSQSQKRIVNTYYCVKECGGSFVNTASWKRPKLEEKWYRRENCPDLVTPRRGSADMSINFTSRSMMLSPPVCPFTCSLSVCHVCPVGQIHSAWHYKPIIIILKLFYVMNTFQPGLNYNFYC